MVGKTLRIVGASAANAVADMRTLYTWRTWTFGWLGRMLAQVTFFTVLGRLVGGHEQMRYLVIGNAVMVCAIESMMAIASTTWERAEGTLPLLVAAPVDLVWVFFGRSLQWPVSGTATSLVALLLLGPLFGVSWQWWQVPVLILLVLLTALTTYCFALFLAALIINANRVRNVVSNATYLVMMAICGVQVPVGFWPPGVRWVAEALPLTHAVEAVRRLADGQPLGPTAAAAGRALLLGLGWLGLAWLSFRVFAARGRRAGAVEFVV